MISASLHLLRWSLVALLLLPSVAFSQQLRVQRTPYTAWLDFNALAATEPVQLSLPAWFESLQSDPVLGPDGKVAQTTFRLRFRGIPTGSNRELLFRFFYEDVREDGWSVSGWSETGELRFSRGPYGLGLHLPASETLTLPMDNVDYLDITAPGDGSSVRGAFLSWLGTAETRHTLDFARAAEFVDPFENQPARRPSLDDWFLSGRVRATLSHGIVRLNPQTSASESWEFELPNVPFVSVLSFEVLNADPLVPIEILVNDQPIGSANIPVPDLADPAYEGVARPVDRGVSFRYAGWLRGQKAIPGAALKPGYNSIVLRLPADSGPVAIRSIELQLKNEWQNSGHTITP